MKIRKRLRINGIVQGVGFRPFVFNLAAELGVSGCVFNSAAGVIIEAEGPAEKVSAFQSGILSSSPPLSRIIDCQEEEIPPKNDREFRLLKSETGKDPDTLIAPDVALCDNCLREMRDSGDRRFGYPFINCTDCGPRFTIVHSIPYDRAFTSMNVFPLCPDCRREYEDPANRRFHAQPNACPVCGPALQLVYPDSDREPGHSPASPPASNREIITRVHQELLKGKIIAVRGIGGFHLAVDAANEKAVKELRKRKGREEKPFAIMARDLESVKKACLVSGDEEPVIASWQRPIVLLEKGDNSILAPSVAPENSCFGMMLPYAPLHYLLMDGPLPYLVMTSGNFTDEPIAISNQEAIERLSKIADCFLLHNREILQRCDDSIVRVVDDNRLAILRRSRGFVPYPVFINRNSPANILACGPELKNTIAYLKGDRVFISQHIGDLDNPEAFRFYKHCIDHLGNILKVKPEYLAWDLHPEYLSTKWAAEQELPGIGVQHHHAHLASVLADNNVEGPAIGIILDGTGYGTDGTIWGGEVLAGDASGFERMSWLETFRLPGGTMAIKQPWRIALSLLKQTYGEGLSNLPLDMLSIPGEKQITNLLKMTESGLNSPLTSSCGRLFDGVSALLGIKPEIAYEAQAAITLEMAADRENTEYYSEALDKGLHSGAISHSALLQMIVADVLEGVDRRIIASRFHNTLAEIFTRAAVAARKDTGISRAALSGGVMQNVLLSRRLNQSLEREGFQVLNHLQVPANDGGISLGQAVVAASMIEK